MHSTGPGYRASPWLRAAALLALSLVGVDAKATGIESERLRAAIVRETPRPLLVERDTEMTRAAAVAAAIPGAEVFQGLGASMAPLYASRTAVVVAPVRFGDLRKGMTVVYVNRSGRRVAHALTGDVRQGWVAQGMNNDFEDDELVTPANLVGVIVQAFAASPG
jgi:hypothetical protein